MAIVPPDFLTPIPRTFDARVRHVSRMMIRWTLALTLAGAAALPAQQQAYPGWLTDTKQAFDQARRTGKPLFIVFR
jgi:hypothetical protein